MTARQDVLLVGGGGAGLRAAIAIAETNPRLTIGVVSKVYPMRSHTVSAEGGAAGVIRPDDSLDEHAYDTISGGDWLSDQDAVEAFVQEAPRELLRLEHWGCPWSREADGRVGVRPFGGMKKMRTWFAADKTGFHMLHTLFQTSLKYTSIVRYDEWFVTTLLVDDDRVQGVVAIDLMSGRIETILARAVILCTGGCGRVFPFTTNAAIKNGDGMALAYRAGAPLKDMEFVQYHPTGLPFTGILITEAARAEGGYLINKDGYRYLQDYNLGKPEPKPVLRSMELGPRDRLSQAFVKEVEKGRTTETPYGPVVHLDLRHMGERAIETKIPFVRELCLKYQNIDPVTELIPVRPVVHYMMGGVHTDIDGATPLPGLYAAGEVACVSINGANRLGSNSLPELLVFGARAGRAAAEYASSRSDPGSAVLAQGKDEQNRLQKQFLRTNGHRERLSSLREEMQQTLEESAGIYRNGDSLRRGADTLRALRQRFGALAIDDHSQTFNTERITALELSFMLDVAEAIVNSALRREESRGAHQRTDFPDRDDGRFLAHSLVHQTPDGTPRVEYLAGHDHPLAAGRAGLWEIARMGDRITLQVSRYRPETESGATVQEYEVPCPKDWVILDGLNYVKDRLDGTLSYRWSCRMGICGSCGMTVNGEPKLTCATFLADYAPGPVRVEPLRNFPVIRDLVVEIGDFMRKLVTVKPWIIRSEEKPLTEGEYRQTPDELQDYKQFSMCINCMLCYAACPIYGLDPKFIGPAAIALAQRYNLDTRDEGASERLEILSGHEGIWGCTFVGECTKVCPKNVDPAGAIQRYKLHAAIESVKAFFMPRGAQ